MNVNTPDPLDALREELEGVRIMLSRALADPQSPAVSPIAARDVRDRVAGILLRWPRFVEDVEDAVTGAAPQQVDRSDHGLAVQAPTPGAVSQAPIDFEPEGPFLTEPDRLALLAEVLDGVDLGDYDHRILRWLARWDTPTVRTVAALIGRARIAAPVGMEFTCGHCRSVLVIGQPVEVLTVAADAPQRALRRRDNPPEGQS